MNLEALPGVGPGVAAAIRRRFSDDEKFFLAAHDADIQALSSVDGISERRAVELVRAVRGDDAGEQLLATPATRAIHERIIAGIQAHAGTRHGRNRLRLLAPLANPDDALLRTDHILAMKEMVAKIDRDAIRKQLRHLRPLATPHPICDTTRLVIAESSDIYERLHGLGIGGWSILGTQRDIGMAGDMEIVIVAYEEGMELPDLEAIDEVDANSPLCDLAPEAILQWVKVNRSVLQACVVLAELTQRSTVAAAVLDTATALQIPRVDAAQLTKLVEAAHRYADERISAGVTNLSLSGTELLTAMNKGALPAPLKQVVDEAVQHAKQSLREETGFDVDPFLSGYPLELDEEALDRARRRIEGEGRLRRERLERTAARAIALQQEALRAEVSHWLEWDADFALGSFAAFHDLGAWDVASDLSFDEGIHLDLTANVDAQRIHYAVGNEHPVSLLTGANSGGKSTLLEQICQMVLMARMGMPVVGNHVHIPWVDEIHLVTARRGLDAGAFETFLRAFLPASLGGAKRLVLADEVESVTELEAAGKILAFFVERLLATDSLGVIVSHVPHAILDHLEPGSIRVDGIEAKGLDEHNQLVVDRQPVMGRLARSTPELIVQRLAKTTRGAEQALYQQLVARLAR
jgi:DNA mismatch repair protein MutS2